MKTNEEILEAHFGSDYYKIKERDDLQYILRAMEEYADQFKNSHKHGVAQGLPYYQLCPKCFGEGYVPSIGTTSSLHRICPVCNGAKTIYHALSDSFNSDTFIDNVCLSYRHDFGLMAEQDKQRLRFECKEWMRAISNNDV